MCTLWSDLHQSLKSKINKSTTIERFRKEWRLRSEVEHFESPAALVGYLADRDADPAHRNEIYRGLVEMAQAKKRVGLAMELLCLGLWPGLDSIYRRNGKYFRDDLGELVSEIWIQFDSAVRRIDLERVNRIAITVLRNTERALKGKRRQKSFERANQNEFLADGQTVANGGRRFDISHLGLTPGLTYDEEVARLRYVIAKLLGNDGAELIIGRVVCGETCLEAGERLGVKHDAVVSRFRRTNSRLRKKIEKKWTDLASKSACTY